MKHLQQDDIQDSFHEPKRKFRWIHMPTLAIVRATSKRDAVKKFWEHCRIKADKKDIKNG